MKSVLYKNVTTLLILSYSKAMVVEATSHGDRKYDRLLYYIFPLGNLWIPKTILKSASREIIFSSSTVVQGGHKTLSQLSVVFLSPAWHI
jgi:hypothetical protein